MCEKRASGEQTSSSQPSSVKRFLDATTELQFPICLNKWTDVNEEDKDLCFQVDISEKELKMDEFSESITKCSSMRLSLFLKALSVLKTLQNPLESAVQDTFNELVTFLSFAVRKVTGGAVFATFMSKPGDRGQREPHTSGNFLHPTSYFSSYTYFYLLKICDQIQRLACLPTMRVHAC